MFICRGNVYTIIDNVISQQITIAKSMNNLYNTVIQISNKIKIMYNSN